MMDALYKAIESARKVYGSDISIMVARSPAFGDSDCCLIVQGKRHSEVAADLAMMTSGTVKTETSFEWRGIPEHTYSVVEFAAQK